MRIIQSYINKNELQEALPYAHWVIQHVNDPRYMVNAYYCLILEAEAQNDTDLLALYTHARADAYRAIQDRIKYTHEGIMLLREYSTSRITRSSEMLVLLSVIIICILVMCLVIYRRYNIVQQQTSHEKMESLSNNLKELEQTVQEHNYIYNYEKHIAKTLTKYPTPLNRWNDYRVLRRDLAPYLRDWLRELDKLPLTNREKVFCTFMFVYSHLSVKKVAYYMNMSENSMRVSKTGIVRKLGTTSAELPKFLQKLYIPS
jgi:hypothetical protein